MHYILGFYLDVLPTYYYLCISNFKAGFIKRNVKNFFESHFNNRMGNLIMGQCSCNERIGEEDARSPITSHIILITIIFKIDF